MKQIILALGVFLVIYSAGAVQSKKEMMQKKTTEAVDATTEYTIEQKEAFQKNMEEKLTIVKDEISELKKTIVTKSEATQKTMKSQIANLEEKEAKLQKDLSKLRNKTGKAWSHMKNGLSTAWDDFTTSYEKAKNEYQEKNQ